MRNEKINIALAPLLLVALLFSIWTSGVDAKKKAKIKIEKAKKIYTINLTCDSSNPESGIDAVIAEKQEDFEDENYALYKKFRVPDIKKSKMPNLSFYKKESFYNGLNEEFLKPVSTQTQYFFTDGYLWLRSGSKGVDLGKQVVNCSGNTGVYILFIY